MNQQEYLSQISGNVRPVKAPNSSKPGFLSSPIFKIVLIGLVAVIGIIIFGSIISGGKKSPKELLLSLGLHLEGTTTQIGEYQPYLKTSTLRANSASLSTVLADANRTVTEYIENTYSSASPTKKAEEEAEAATTALGDELFHGRITGTLDEVFAYKMAYEIKVIQAEIDSIYNLLKDESFKSSLSSSYNSLNNLYDLFNNFSGTQR